MGQAKGKGGQIAENARRKLKEKSQRASFAAKEIFQQLHNWHALRMRMNGLLGIWSRSLVNNKDKTTKRPSKHLWFNRGKSNVVAKKGQVQNC